VFLCWNYKCSSAGLQVFLCWNYKCSSAGLQVFLCWTTSVPLLDYKCSSAGIPALPLTTSVPLLDYLPCPGLQVFLCLTTCPALNDDDELDPVSLVESAPALLVEVGVPEVPAQCVQQPEVVAEHVETMTYPKSLIF
jgi:hypothetical protein